MAEVILLSVPLLLAMVLVPRTGQAAKRGCGRGCATCGNRHLCHPGQYADREEVAQ